MSKAKGARRERQSRDLLEALGYDVTRAAASRGLWDLVAISSTDVVLVQVKSNAWPCVEEMEAMELAQVPPNCRKLVHRWRDGERLPDVRVVP